MSCPFPKRAEGIEATGLVSSIFPHQTTTEILSITCGGPIRPVRDRGSAGGAEIHNIWGALRVEPHSVESIAFRRRAAIVVSRERQRFAPGSSGGSRPNQLLPRPGDKTRCDVRVKAGPRRTMSSRPAGSGRSPASFCSSIPVPPGGSRPHLRSPNRLPLE